MPDRLNIDIEGLREFLEPIADGFSLSGFGAQLLKDSLYARFYRMSIAEIVDLLDPATLSDKCGIEFERMAAIATGERPTDSEIVKLSRILRKVGLNSKVLSTMRERDYQDSLEDHHCHSGASCL